jgi:transposase
MMGGRSGIRAVSSTSSGSKIAFPINVFVTAALGDLHKALKPHYSDIGRPSIDPELMIRMLIVGYCCGIRSERKLCQEVELHLAYRWFCKLDLDDEVPHHSTLYENRLGHFRESDLQATALAATFFDNIGQGQTKPSCARHLR